MEGSFEVTTPLVRTGGVVLAISSTIPFMWRGRVGGMTRNTIVGRCMPLFVPRLKILPVVSDLERLLPDARLKTEWSCSPWGQAGPLGTDWIKVGHKVKSGSRPH